MSRDGDTELYQKYGDELLTFASALVGASGAEDVFSTAFVRAMTSPGWSSVDNARAYLYKAVMNEARRTRLSTSRRLEREWRAMTSADADQIPVDLDVLVALRRLTIRQRAAVFLTYWADLPPAETARTLGWSPRTVERELTTARRRLEVLLR